MLNRYHFGAGRCNDVMRHKANITWYFEDYISCYASIMDLIQRKAYEHFLNLCQQKQYLVYLYQGIIGESTNSSSSSEIKEYELSFFYYILFDTGRYY